MQERIRRQANYWATSESFDAATRAEIKQILGNEEELRERFASDLEFGTGGMRGIVGGGTNRINVYNIRKAALALGKYLQSEWQKETITVAVSYDSRTHSRSFAEATCATLAAIGIRTLITKKLRPVPVLSFMVRHFGCQAGVCVTASHNPPQYNGFKVYWRHGGQVIPPHDTGIITEFKKITDYGKIALLPYPEALAAKLVTEISEEIDDLFISHLSSLHRGNDREVRAVYSPLHGSGLTPIMKACQYLNYKDIHVVAAQRDADGNFPTVSSPNPEDSQAMQLAVELATKIDADLVLATDPDCDRLGVMVREGDSYHHLDGNQLLCVLLEYVLTAARNAGELTAQDLVVRTTVTTELVDAIASFYGVHCAETLTGFKWIGELIENHETGKTSPRRRFLYGGEESFGLLYGRSIRDKDGIGACCLALKATAHFKTRGQGWFDVLDEIYLRHGVYHHELMTFTLPGLEGKTKIEKLLADLRRDPTSVGSFPVHKVIDYRSGEVREKKAGKLVLRGKVSLPKSNLLQFLLPEDTKISIRPSGTEPKIKYYIAVRKDVPDAMSLPQIKAACAARAAAVKDAIALLVKR